MPKKVAIVGAGVTGLTSIKCCLDEGLEPTCFERSNDIGGVWRYTEYVEEGRASLYKSLVSNTCKEMSAFSDFPYPEDFPVFLPHARLLEYLQLYTKHFDLRKHIHFQTTVISIKKHPEFSATGQWDVITETNGKQKSAVFDAVMVCIGYLTEPSLPLSSFPGIKKFKGQYFHSRDYKSPEVFRDKRVLVIGMGNSGSDIAVEATQTAKKVILSTNRGSWVISRVFDNGYPWDMVFLTRLFNLIRNLLPTRITGWLIESRASQWFNHRNYGLFPKDRSVLREIVINDILPSCIISGQVSVRPTVKEFKENTVQFTNTPNAEEVDVVVFATGYKASFPFIDESIVKVENKQASLYKYIFPPKLEKPTLAIMGFIRAQGPIMPTSEIQARWVTRIFKDLCKLPPVNTMMTEIDEIKKNKPKRFGLTYDEALKTDWLLYNDQLASAIGIKPSVSALLLKDPELATKIFFGPSTAYQYRLTGPGKWDGARSAIMNQWERTLKATRTRDAEDASNFLMVLLKVLTLFALFVGIYFGFN
ncbi:flavin-containing monooxygenase 1 [Hemicordylus capensis]|uniref:flavin-containing monooxygenase 1 n=1 Tax=Hemicordylus capensis TaxID=884348 RepID=UPI0023047022|nr:flavin-containing monooxygenase 1 [Hemicordylus capensis]XP_053169499.1 flavin-containing monooxygenase 1 [Hemicordylus capensis]